MPPALIVFIPKSIPKGNQVAKGKNNKKSTKKKAEAGGAPQIITMKGGLPVGKLLDEVLFTMEDELRISKKAAKDFQESSSPLSSVKSLRVVR
jgi:hypothetical protein